MSACHHARSAIGRKKGDFFEEVVIPTAARREVAFSQPVSASSEVK